MSPPSRGSRSASRSVVITGASMGIGRSCAHAWAKRGARLVLNARSSEMLIDVARECGAIGGEALLVPGDITRDDVRSALVDRAVEHFGGLDVLVNNAGVGLYGTIESVAPETFRSVFELNVIAPLALVQRALPALRVSRGTIVMMSSIAGVVATPRSGAYSATKYALEALAQSLRAELEVQKSGVRVCAVRPGLTETPFAQNAHYAQGKHPRPSWMPAMSPDEVAEATVHAVENEISEVNLTASARAIAALARLSRPALRRALTAMGRRMGIPAD